MEGEESKAKGDIDDEGIHLPKFGIGKKTKGDINFDNVERKDTKDIGMDVNIDGEAKGDIH